MRLAAEREGAGLGLKADTLRAKVQLAEAERRRLGADNDLQLARRRLALAMGRADGEVEIVRPLTPADLPLPADGRRAAAGGPAAAQYRAEAAARGTPPGQGRLPAAAGALLASYAWHNPSVPFGTEADSWQAGAGLTWNLFDGLRRSGRIEGRGRPGTGRRPPGRGAAAQHRPSESRGAAAGRGGQAAAGPRRRRP